MSEVEKDDLMGRIAEFLDGIFNGGGERRNGFVLIVRPFTEGPAAVNYISNVQREGVVNMLRETADDLEASAQTDGRKLQ